ncbi:MAG: glycosyl hydrolase family 31, partial [Bacteroidales bacterium]|nr:glycosyl hydrolase family 31 [Bacteroidales bacterium]
MKRLILSIFMALTAYQVFAATHGTEGILLDATQSLYIIPLNDNTLRVQYRLCQEQKNIPFDAYLDASSTFTDYKVVKKADIIKVQCKAISVIYNKAYGCLTFYDVNNKIILQEAVNSSSSAKNGEFFTINQSFNSPDNEFIIGLGQFQDGYLNIKGLSRRLTQVNTQIAIPMVISNMGYGLLWNNYGITEFNPLSNKTVLVQKSEVGPAVSVNATGTAGNVVERRAFGSFEAEITVPQDGMYSILLDVGQAMGRKHYLEIDSKSVINISNTWLPPTTSTLVYLSAGNHKLTVQGSRGDKPVVYWDAVNNLNTFKSELASAIDYTVFAGNADNIIASLRSLTGRSPMQPKYALGYIHCRERYDTQEQVLQAAHEFRNRNIPVDVIVQDWQWWGKYGWNAMKFDEDKYPNPEAMVKELHDMDMKFMLSVWSKIDRKSEVGKDMESKGYYIDGTDWIDFFNENASKEYWNYSKNNILKATDLDGWWQDATEPENDDLHNRKVNSNTLNGDLYRNVYPNLVNQTVYNGLVESDSERRPLI